MSWLITFSLFSLHDNFPNDDYQCWLLFVKACVIMCSQIIKIADVVVGHSLLMNFCRRFEQMYGKERVTPNMHMHTHLINVFWIMVLSTVLAI